MKSQLIYKITKIYLIIFFIIIGIYCGVGGTYLWGEWDDYSLPAVSILTEHNFGISENDIEAFKKWFPEWSSKIDKYSLSGYYTASGEEMTWYFPTYSIACIPLMLLLKVMYLPVSYAFVYTNYAFLMLLLICIWRYLKTDDLHKLMLIVLLSANPIVFYLAWPSAEVFIYVLLGLAMVSWYNEWYKRAAIFVSIAGMLNPIIMFVGIIMIAEYLIKIGKTRQPDESYFKIYFKNLKNIILYGSCYIIGLIPMIYNLYNAGHINLTASYSNFVMGSESTFSRFISYIFDFNYGILPYYPIILICSFVFLILAVYKRNWNYIKYFAAFYINIFLYAIMVHINCGMTGIARYNAWNAVILIFAVVMFFSELLSGKGLNKALRALLFVSSIYTAVVVFAYGPIGANRTICSKWTPIAEWVINNFTDCYNPLHSTFYSRTCHVDGGYVYELPVVYTDKNEKVRKILATSEEIEYLETNYVSLSGYDEEFKKILNTLDENEDYVNIPKKLEVIKTPLNTEESLLGKNFKLELSADLKYSDTGSVTGKVIIYNMGDSLTDMSSGKYPVNIGISIVDKNNNIIEKDYLHIPIMEKGILLSNKSREINLELPDLQKYIESGYGIRIEVVQEGISWFADTAQYFHFNVLLDTDSSLLERNFKLELSGNLVYGDNNSVHGVITVKNNGSPIQNMSSGKYPVNIGISIVDKDKNIIDKDYLHLCIQEEGILKKNDTVDVKINLPDMKEYVDKGYGIRVEIVQEAVSWFDDTAVYYYFK